MRTVKRPWLYFYVAARQSPAYLSVPLFSAGRGHSLIDNTVLCLVIFVIKKVINLHSVIFVRLVCHGPRDDHFLLLIIIRANKCQKHFL